MNCFLRSGLSLVFFIATASLLRAQDSRLRQDLCRRWVSAKTENINLNDTADTLVFHYFRSPEAQQFPASHRFAGFSLGEDGLLLVYHSKKNAEDTSADFSYGAWYFTGNNSKNLRLVLDNREAYYHIVYLDENKLVLAKSAK